MSCTCGDGSCKRHFPCSTDRDKLKDLYKERYARHAARLRVKRLDKPESQVHPFYKDTRTKDRVYLPEVIVPIFGPFEGWTRSLLFFGIDNEKALIFTAAVPVMEELGWTFKPGDIIIYTDVEFEVLKVGKNSESYYDQWEYAFELNIATYIPNRGS